MPKYQLGTPDEIDRVATELRSSGVDITGVQRAKRQWKKVFRKIHGRKRVVFRRSGGWSSDRKGNELKVGLMNTRALGAASRGSADQAEKLKCFRQLWQNRGWDAVILTDVRWKGRSSVKEVGWGKNTWVIVHKGVVAIALSRHLTERWRRGGE